MGLDMYLSKKTYIGAEYKHNNITGNIDLQRDGKSVKVNMSRVSYIEESVGYWRKANHIHKWFVENIQEGKDDCNEYDVSIEQLEELLVVCKKVTEIAKLRGGEISNAEEVAELLPTGAGFFFGNTSYNNWYLNDIAHTIEIIEQAIAEKNEEDYNVEYVYRASW